MTIRAQRFLNAAPEPEGVQSMQTGFKRRGIPDYDKVRMADGNHIWLNANSCVRPTEGFRLWLADEILTALNDDRNILIDHDSKVRVLYLTITKS